MTWIVLLRGINVGGQRLPMSELRSLCEAAGGREVRTYLQSGNVVMRHDASEAELIADLERRLAEHCGFSVPTVLRTPAELDAAVAACPYPTDGDPTKLVLSFAAAPFGPGALGKVDPAAFAPEELWIKGRDLYVWLPVGQGNSPLMKALARTPAVRQSTARNWRTVLALQEMARG